MLESIGFVRNTKLWIEEQTVQMWEAYKETTDNVNLADKYTVFCGKLIGF
jgi:hypothetical protein